MRSSFGQALFITFAILVNVLVAAIYIPFIIAYYLIAGAFTVLVFVVCGSLVMVYKFAAWLARLGK